MTLVSMTGFAEAHGSLEGARWRWEVKSVNGRGLDLRMRLPPGFDAIELAARTLANDRFKRGSIQASLTFESETSRSPKIDPFRPGGSVGNGKGAGNRSSRFEIGSRHGS